MAYSMWPRRHDDGWLGSSKRAPLASQQSGWMDRQADLNLLTASRRGRGVSQQRQSADRPV